MCGDIGVGGVCGDIGVGGGVWGYWCRWRCVGLLV